MITNTNLVAEEQAIEIKNFSSSNDNDPLSSETPTLSADEFAIEMDVFHSDHDTSNNANEPLLIEVLPAQNSQIRLLSEQALQHLRNYSRFYLGGILGGFNVINYFAADYLLATYLTNTENLESNFVKGFQQGQQFYKHDKHKTCVIRYNERDNYGRTHQMRFTEDCAQTLPNLVYGDAIFELTLHFIFSSFFIAIALASPASKLKHKWLIYLLSNAVVSFLFTMVLGPILFNRSESLGFTIGEFSLCEPDIHCKLSESINFDNYASFSGTHESTFLLMLFAMHWVLSSITLASANSFITAFSRRILNNIDINPPIDNLEQRTVALSLSAILEQLKAYTATCQSDSKFIENANNIFDTIEQGNENTVKDFDQKYLCAINHEIMEFPLKIVDIQGNIHYYDLFAFDRYASNAKEDIIDPMSKEKINKIKIDLRLQRNIHDFINSKIEKSSASLGKASQHDLLFFDSEKLSNKKDIKELSRELAKTHKRSHSFS